MNEIHIGFTGTRGHVTQAQIARLEELFSGILAATTHVHHGDCIGADVICHFAALRHQKNIIIHPPIRDALRAYCEGGLLLDPKEYIDRNHAIVDQTSTLIAMPDGPCERVRSGTWATIRYARARGRLIHYCFP
jgi:hypothetical protein